jgi:uncharacterized phage-associated protein
MCLGIKANYEKIGNLLILLSSEIKPLYHTKLLKLLFLIDKTSMEETGVPVTWLEYQAWKLGPVAPSVYNIKFQNSGFEKYVHAFTDITGTLITPVAEFSEDEFTDYELDLIHRIIRKYRNTSGPQLVKLTHEKNGLWEKVVIRYQLESVFSSDEIGISPYSVDLTELITGDPELTETYQQARESLEFQAALNEENAAVC